MGTYLVFASMYVRLCRIWKEGKKVRADLGRSDEAEKDSPMALRFIL